MWMRKNNKCGDKQTGCDDVLYTDFTELMTGSYFGPCEHGSMVERSDLTCSAT
jgi:hypothetical protein